MATIQHQQTTTSNPKVCFSFAAYAKSIISNLITSDVHVTAGLTDVEISAVESAAGFKFPPDLRSILSEALPVGPGFPNWRSTSCHQLRLLSSLPVISLVKEVSRGNFWAHSWGPRPSNNDDSALTLAHNLLRRAPPLVPVFKHCYIPSEPNLAGNPVFYVHGGVVKLVSVDVGGFFREIDFWRKDRIFRRHLEDAVAPPWAAARRVEFWSEVAARGSTPRRWWSGELGGCLEDVMWRLRDGGWGEEDVREMMMIDGGDDTVRGTRGRRRVGAGDGVREGVVRHVRRLSRELLRGGWSIDDVVYSLGGDDLGKVESGILEGEAWVDFQCSLNKSNQI